MYRFSLVFLLSTAVTVAYAQEFSVPKYPSKLKTFTRESGVRPGAKVTPGGKDTAVFHKTYTRPAGLRLLVRTNCGARPKQQELINAAKNRSLPDGPPVQIDWGDVGRGRVSYYAVLHMQRTRVTVNLRNNGGVYQPGNKSNSDQEWWDVQQLRVDNNDCPATEKVSKKGLRVAVLNVLTTATLKHFRRSPSAN